MSDEFQISVSRQGDGFEPSTHKPFSALIASVETNARCLFFNLEQLHAALEEQSSVKSPEEAEWFNTKVSSAFKASRQEIEYLLLKILHLTDESLSFAKR
jgi:hypothetical protein